MPFPTLGLKHLTAEFLLKGRAWVREVGPAVAMERLARAVAPLPDRITVTYWERVRASYAGTETRRGSGREWSGSLEQYADWHRTYAPLVRAKGQGRCIAHGRSLYGGSSDEECIERSFLWCDLDDGGKAARIRSVLQQIGLSYVESERVRDSISHHMETPIVGPLTVEGKASTWKEEHYRPEYGWLLGVFSELGEFACSATDPESGKPSVSHLGYDANTDRLLAQHFVFSRRHPLDPVPVVQHHVAGALDWGAALRETGYLPPAKNARSYFRAKRPEQAHETDPHAHGESPLERAAVAAGWALGTRPRGGVYVRCPGESDHRDLSNDITKAYVCNKKFQCSRGSCQGRGADYFVSKLPPDVREALENERACDGVRRARTILDATQPVASGNVEQTVRKAIRDRKPGELIAAVIPPGGGKSYWLRQVLGEIGYGTITTPTTKLAAQTCEKMPVATKLHRGVLSVLREDGTPECQQYELGRRVQNAGGSVPDILCKTCRFASDCTARLPIGDGQVHVAPHPMHGMIRKPFGKMPDAPMSWDESPNHDEDVSVTRADMAWALSRLELDEQTRTAIDRVLTYKYRAGIHPFALILAETSKDPQHDVQASALRWSQTDPRAQELLEKARQSVTSHYDARVHRYVENPEAVSSWNEVLQKARTQLPWVPDALLIAWKAAVCASHTDVPGLTCQLNQNAVSLDQLHPHEQDKALQALRVFRAIRACARGFDMRWNEHGGVTTKVLTSEGELLRSAGGTLLDATPDLEMIKAINPKTTVLYANAPDGCPGVTRVHLYRARTHRTALCPDKKPDWKRVVPLVRLIFDWARAKDHKTLWIGTFRPIAEGWKQSPEISKLVSDWTNEGREIAWEYYRGPLRGLDTWESWTAFATLGDPWPELGSAGATVDAFEIENPEAWLLQAVRDELAQCHGRARDPQRKVPCDHLHVAQIPPGFWNAENAEVRETWATRPRGATAMSPEELVEAFGLLGWSTRRAAIELAVGQSTVTRYRTGAYPVPEPVAVRVRECVSLVVMLEPSLDNRDSLRGFEHHPSPQLMSHPNTNDSAPLQPSEPATPPEPAMPTPNDIITVAPEVAAMAEQYFREVLVEAGKLLLTVPKQLDLALEGRRIVRAIQIVHDEVDDAYTPPVLVARFQAAYQRVVRAEAVPTLPPLPSHAVRRFPYGDGYLDATHPPLGHPDGAVLSRGGGMATGFV